MKKKTELLCIVDKSSSMYRLRKDTIEQFNSFLDEQRNYDADDEVIISLVLFGSPNSENLIIDSENIKTVENLTEQTYLPNGTTALYDALGKSMKSLHKKIKKSKNKPDEVLVIILTDGEENSSQLYDKKYISKLIDKRTKKNNWDFIYLGANQDSFKEGSKINIKNNVNFRYSSDGIKDAYKNISTYTLSKRM